MYITKKHIPRRTFLRGVGVTLALPLLDSMLPAQTPLARTAAGPNTRFIGIFGPHGWAPGYWVPTNEGPLTELPLVLAPLEQYKDKMVVTSNLDSTSSMPPAGTSGGDHARAAAFMSGAVPKKTVGADVYLGETIDQIIARKIGQDTPLSSLQLGIEDIGSNSGACGWGYHCVYSNSISWATPTKALPMEINPTVVFERLFGDGSTPEQRISHRQEDRSILDRVTRKLATLKTKIGPKDRSRLDDYMTDIRELERRLQISAAATSEVPTPDVPFGVPESFDEHMKLMYDLQTLAFQGDLTRVSAMMYARDVSHRPYPECGVTTGFHEASHHGEDPKRREEYAKMNRYHLQILTYFLKKLKSTPDGESNLLENSVILYGSNMGNANQHLHVNVGHMLLGGASGKLKGGRHVKSPDGSSTANLLLSTLGLFGIERDFIGDSTGRVSL